MDDETVLPFTVGWLATVVSGTWYTFFCQGAGVKGWERENGMCWPRGKREHFSREKGIQPELPMKQCCILLCRMASHGRFWDLDAGPYRRSYCSFPSSGTYGTLLPS